MDHSKVMKDSCGEHRRLRHHLIGYVGQKLLLVARYRDVYEKT